MRRVLLPLAAAMALAAGPAGPAWGHAQFTGVTSYPAGTEQRLTLDVPEELGAAVRTTGIDVHLPDGWEALACEGAPPWGCEVTPPGPDQQVRWTRDPAAPPSPADETFAFTARTGPPGPVAVPVVQRYADGSEARWIEEGQGSDKPAPRLTVTPSGAPAPTATTGPAVTTTHAPPTTGQAAAGGGDEDGDGGGDTGVLVAIAVLVAAGLAGAGLALRRRRG